MAKVEQERIWTKSFISISITQLLLFTVFYTLLTTLPIYVIDDLGGSESQAGLVATFMLISAIAIRPFSAKIIDMVGKKKILVFSVSFFFLISISYLFVYNYFVLMIFLLYFIFTLCFFTMISYFIFTL